MSFAFKVNQHYDTNPLAWWDFFTMLLAAGWTKVKDSDGITYSASGTQVTGGGAGAHGYDNAWAWVVLQYPNSTRQICIQRDNQTSPYSASGSRIKYSYAGFSGGSPSATRVPSATDELVILGGGTDAAPSVSSLFSGQSKRMKIHMCVGGKDERYAFYVMTIPYGSGNGGIFFFDPLAIGSYNVADPDPFVISVQAGSNWLYSVGQSFMGYMGEGTPRQYGSNDIANALIMTGMYFPAIADGVGSLPPHHISGKDTTIPVGYARRGLNFTGNGFKGFSTLFQWSLVSRSQGYLMDFLGAGDRVYINKILFPWPPGRIPFMTH